MQKENLIAVKDFCVNHNIEISFISSLQQSGLIEIITFKKKEFIDASQLQHLEKIVRFHFELDINIEGIEVISNLLQRINSMKNEISTLRNRIGLYETNETSNI